MGIIGEVLLISSIGVHYVDFTVSISLRPEGNPFTVGRP